MQTDKSLSRCDPELVELSRSGNRDAFDELISKYQRNCLNVAISMLRDRTEAQDQVQQAIWKAFEHLDQYLGEGEFSAWLLRIVVNECRMLMRWNKRIKFVSSDSGQDSMGRRATEVPSVTRDPENETVKCEMMDVLRTEISHIPPFFRQVIMLRYVDQLPMGQVADRLGITIPAAKSRLTRARGELRQRMNRRFGVVKHMMPLTPKQTLPATFARYSGSAI